MALLSGSGLGSLFNLQLGCQPRGLSSEGLTGAGGSASKMAHSHGCGQKVSVPCHVDISVSFLIKCI